MEERRPQLLGDSERAGLGRGRSLQSVTESSVPVVLVQFDCGGRRQSSQPHHAIEAERETACVRVCHQQGGHCVGD